MMLELRSWWVGAVAAGAALATPSPRPPIAQLKPGGPTGFDRRSRWHNEIQSETKTRRVAPRSGPPEFIARERHPRRSRPPAEFAEASGRQGPPVYRAPGPDAPDP